MKINFEYFTALQYEVKALRAQVKAYESGMNQEKHSADSRMRMKKGCVKKTVS